MRFEVPKPFKIDDLLLDEGNYRFQSAADQDDCIAKIFNASKPYFINLMTSLAEDDLGEPLLVYLAPDKRNIVLDGNRRAAALKVLADPSVAPTPNLAKKAVELMKHSGIKFDDIHAQVSTDKDLILKTVYERHASGQGKGRIDWNAFANAKFRFREQISDNQDWYDIALLMELEDRDRSAVDFVYGGKYSHEVFRRIVRAAVQEGIIERSIFSDSKMRINKSKKNELKRALYLVQQFLAYMEEGRINLSREGGTYADRKKIGEYLAQFRKPQETSTPPTDESEANPSGDNGGNSSESGNQVPEGESVPPGGTVDGQSTDSREDDDASEQKAGRADNESTAQADEDAQEEKLQTRRPTRIPPSQKIIVLLNRVGSWKLSNLYYSLTNLSLQTHPTICIIGAWALFETLARRLGASETTSFEAYFGSRANNWFTSGSEKKAIRSSLAYILHEGNINKHNGVYVSMDATPLVNHFQVLEPLILKALQEIIDADAKLK